MLFPVFTVYNTWIEKRLFFLDNNPLRMQQFFDIIHLSRFSPYISKHVNILALSYHIITICLVITLKQKNSLSLLIIYPRKNILSKWKRFFSLQSSPLILLFYSTPPFCHCDNLTKKKESVVGIEIWKSCYQLKTKILRKFGIHSPFLAITQPFHLFTLAIYSRNPLTNLHYQFTNHSL